MGFIAGGALAAAGSVAGSMMSANAAGKAADAQQQAADAQLALQREMYYQGRTDQAPWRIVGGRSLNELAALYGIQPYGPGDEGYPNPTNLKNENIPSTPGGVPLTPGRTTDAMGNWVGPNPLPGSVPRGDANYLQRLSQIDSGEQYGQPMQPGSTNQPRGGGNTEEKVKPWNREKAQALAKSHFFTSPQYEWNLEQGMRGIDNRLAAMGMFNSGAALKEASRYASGLASGEWQGYTNQLANMAGLGQVSANQGAALGAQYAQMGGNALQYGGNARGSGYINQANAWNQGLGNMMYAGNRYGLFGGQGQQQPYNSGWQYNPYQGSNPAFQGSYGGSYIQQPGG